MSKRILLDALYHDNNRTEFVIPSSGKAIQTDMKVLNVGATDMNTAATTAGTPTKNVFAFNTGVFSILKSATLLSNQQVLDYIRDVPKWLAFNENKTPKGFYKGIARPLHKVAMDVSHQSPNSVIAINPEEVAVTADANGKGTLVGNVTLSHLFPCLSR